MNSATTSAIVSNSLGSTLKIATTLGRKLHGGEVIELIGDLGSGKTAFVRGLAKGIGSQDQVQSPSFTISRIYNGKNLAIHHFDFHRLDEPGIVKQELAEAIDDGQVVAIEWARGVQDVLPKERLRITFEARGEDSRQLTFEAIGSSYQDLIKGLQ